MQVPRKRHMKDLHSDCMCGSGVTLGPLTYAWSCKVADVLASWQKVISLRDALSSNACLALAPLCYGSFVRRIGIRLRGGSADLCGGPFTGSVLFVALRLGYHAEAAKYALDRLLQYPISLSVSARRGMFKSRPVRFRDGGIDRGADPGFGGPSLSEP